MYITLNQIRRQFGNNVKANIIPGIITKIYHHTTGQFIQVMCVELNKKTPKGMRQKKLRIVDAGVNKTNKREK